MNTNEFNDLNNYNSNNETPYSGTDENAYGSPAENADRTSADSNSVNRPDTDIRQGDAAPEVQNTQITNGVQGAQNTQAGQGAQNTQDVQGAQNTQAGQGAQNTQAGQGSQDAQNTQASQEARASQSESVTYSWVNPKLQTERGADRAQQSERSLRWSEDAYRTQTNSSSSDAASSDQKTGSTSYNGMPSGTGSAGTGYGRGTRHTGSMKKGTKKSSGGRKWMKTIAAALVFGLVAGSVMFGVNRAGNAIFGSGQKADTSSTQSYAKIATTSTTDNASSDLSKSLDDSTKTEGEKAYAGSVAEVAANAMPSLVTISTMSVQEMQSFFGGTQEYEVEGAGTGVIVGQNDAELLIATNNHVVEGATEVSIGFVDDQVVEAFIKGTDPSNDLAVVGVKLSDIPEETMNKIKVVAIGNSDDLALGEQVVAIGNALGYGQSVTSGYISAFNRDLELSDGMSTFVSSGLIQTDAAINAGNSGGALLNMRGELVGINEAKVSGGGGGEASVDNVGYSIPISKAEPILEELMNLETKEKVAEEEKGYLGIRCADVNQETSERYNIPVGVYVREIAEDGPAAEAGLVVGDVITKIDGKIVSAYSDLEAALSYCKAGETIDIIVQRQVNGAYEEQTLSVTLGKQAVLDKLDQTEETGPRMQEEPFGD